MNQYLGGRLEDESSQSFHRTSSTAQVAHTAIRVKSPKNSLRGPNVLRQTCFVISWPETVDGGNTPEISAYEDHHVTPVLDGFIRDTSATYVRGSHTAKRPGNRRTERTVDFPSWATRELRQADFTQTNSNQDRDSSIISTTRDATEQAR